MRLGDRWTRSWRRWQHRHWCLGVDDTGDAVRWVCLRSQSGRGNCLVGAGQWSLGDESVGLSQAGLQSLPIALATRATVQRGQVIPQGLADEDRDAWARASMAQVMGLMPAELVVDWGADADGGHAPPSLWLAAVRASVMQRRVQWAQERGAPLRILDAQSSALSRVLCISAQDQPDPVWLWWAGADEAHVCTGWWHLGHWHDRCDVAVDLRALASMPGALLNLVKSAQANKATLTRKHWWWAGAPLAAWAEQWAADPPQSCQAWVCQAAPIPFGPEIETITQRSAHGWALAMGLALHPGWHE